MGLQEKAYWCQRDSSAPLFWRSHEIYMFAVILAAPSVIMSVAYGMIATEMCKCVKQREAMSAHNNTVVGNAKGPEDNSGSR